jgi:pyruvate dehydrogenase E2 component (dihydrolipoamide acetyltransferase)
MGRVDLVKLRKTTPFRKIAMGTWGNSKNPSVYGAVEIELQSTLNHLKEYEKKHQIKLTPTHLVARAATYCLQKRPEINGLIRGWQIYLRKNVRIFFQVNIPGHGAYKKKHANLGGVCLDQMETKTLGEIACELTLKAQQMKGGDYQELSTSMKLFKYLPGWASGLALDFTSWLIYGLNLNLSLFGLPRDPFGSIMITNVGGLGVDMALVPLVPYSRVPLIISVGAIREKPWVVDGQVEVRPVMTIGVTFDHRFMDGIHAAQMVQDFKDCFAHPSKILFNDEFDLKSLRKDYL